MKILKSPALKGTFILMAAGLLTRFIGFYYRIFLSSKIGAEGMGLYQMIFPVYGLCFSLCVSGIHTSISRYVCRKDVRPKTTLTAGTALALPLSCLCSGLLLIFGDAIAIYYLHDSRCGLLLRIIALSLPMAVIHSCISGYFLGKRDAVIPAISQLFEQVIRVLSVYIIFHCYADSKLGDMSITGLSLVAVAGLIIGEIGSSILCIVALLIEKKRTCVAYLGKHHAISSLDTVKGMIRPIYTMAYPLTMTRVILGILHSLEASAVPFFLKRYGLSHSEALSLYGILTAMAMPFIMFPATFTNAICQMLIPTIAQADSVGNKERIHALSTKALMFSLIFGFFCTALFLMSGNFLGTHFFHSELAGGFITILAWLCPLMFASSVMGSILNGLGQTKATFYHNLASSILLLAFIVLAMPRVGILGFLWGLLASELLCAVLHVRKVFADKNR